MIKAIQNPGFWAALYLAGLVLTFGHAFNACRDTSDSKVGFSKTEVAVGDGLVCSMFWPLYWSIQLFK